MTRPFLFSAIFAFTLCGSFHAQAGGHEPPEPASTYGDVAAPGAPPMGALPVSTTNADIFVELVAADFFESNLRLSQARLIEAATAKRYLSLDEMERARFRAYRRNMWRAMSPQKRAALRGVKRPAFANLDEGQKLTFRKIASQELGDGAAEAVQPGEI